MKSIQTKLIFVISAILLVVVASFLLSSTGMTNAMLNNDSDRILLSAADYYANIIDDNFRSTEQSVGTIYNYAIKRAQTYRDFLYDSQERDRYTYDVSELGKSIAENTRGAMAVYLRYNPVDYGPISGFWYTINLNDSSWQPSIPTDMSLYEPDDVEHVGWYYIPVSTGRSMWMDPYYNANLGVDMISYIIPYYFEGYEVGIIGMDISMELLEESVAEVTVYENGRAFLISTDGDLIYHEDYPQGIDFENLSTQEQKYFSDVLNEELDVVNLFAGRDGTQQKLVLKELKNGMILGIYAPVSEINAPQSALLKQQLMLSVVIFILATVIMMLWVRSITRPLKKMTAVAEHYANGNFDEEMSVQGEDEIGILSRSLQTMSTSLKQQIEIADSANRAKSEFLSNMSHEIRTPINAVLGMNEMILRDTKDKKILDYAGNVRSAGRTLLSLVNTILDFSKIESGKMEILPVVYDTASLINNLVNSISERARDKGLKLNIRIDETIPSVLFGDDVRVSQVIMNLLTNAVKYTKEGSVTLSISTDSRTEEEIRLAVKVSDTGIGIRREDMDKLFESFARIEEKRNRNIEGTGLGMAIVSRLLQMMDSKLEVESTYGEGSAFSFVIKQKIIDQEPLGDYRERVRENQSRQSEEECPRMEGARILVVDDYDMNLSVMRNFLGLYGIVPDLAASGTEAIEAVNRKDYHIIFLDHMMPGLDGIETLARLKEYHLIKEGMVVIALTANAVVGARDTYMQAGFDDYLTKPIEVKKLEETLLHYLPKDLVHYDKPPETPAEEEKAGEEEVSDDTETPKIEEADDDAFAAALEKMGISVEEGLVYSADSMEIYREVLASFVEKSAERGDDLAADFEKKDWKAYQILVHSFKSGSRTVGAMEVSEQARALEMAAKEGDTAYVEEHHAAFLERYRKLTEGIRDLLKKQPDQRV